MRVTCPACAATYDVPDARIGAGRRLRCARCQHDWFVTPPAPTERPPAESTFARAVEQAAARTGTAGVEQATARTGTAGVEQAAVRPGTPAEPRLSPAPTASDSAFDPQPPRGAAAPGLTDSGRPDAMDRPAMPTAPPPRAAGGRDGAHLSAAPEPRMTPPLQGPNGPRPASRPGPAASVDRSGGLMAAWVVSLMLFFGFAAAVVLYRIEIMEAWPPAERLYAALGMLGR